MKIGIVIKFSFYLALSAVVHGQNIFTQVTDGDIANDLGSFIYCAWSDFNNDGFLDLFVCNYGGAANVLYLNNADGTFAKIANGAPLADLEFHVGAAAGDYDNDGNTDLIVSSGVGAPAASQAVLYHGNGDGTFSRVNSAGLTPKGYFGPVTWGDYDGDGLIDLFIGDHGANDNGGKNLLFHNNGGSFTRITAGPVVTDTSLALEGTWTDYDNDGREDLLVINDSTFNFLYHNNGNGNFTRVLTNAVATDRWVGGANGATWGDYDNDGWPDLFVTGNSGTNNRLYHNNGDGTFTTAPSVPMDLRQIGSSSLGAAWGDYDNDGLLDLFVSSYNGFNRIFHNDGGGNFSEITTDDSVIEIQPYCESVSWVDYDNDGSLDLFVTRSNDYGSGIPVSNLLYHNNGNANGWLEIKLTGTASNRSAIGAKVRVQATIGGAPVWQMREINNGGGRWVQPLVAHFGLGDATNADILRIEWPSGIIQELTNVASGQILKVVEHKPGVVTTPKFTDVSRLADGTIRLSAASDAGSVCRFEASTNLVNWSQIGLLTNTTGNIQFIDPNANNYAYRFYRLSLP